MYIYYMYIHIYMYCIASILNFHESSHFLKIIKIGLLLHIIFVL